MPGAFPTPRVTDGLASRDAQADEFSSTRACQTPAFPIAHPQAASQPLVEFVEQLQLRGQAEVTHPATQITAQFAHPPVHRDAPATAGQLADASFEPGLVLLRHVDRRSASAKDEAQVLDFVRLHDAAFGFIHHQPQMSCEIAVH